MEAPCPAPAPACSRSRSAWPSSGAGRLRLRQQRRSASSRARRRTQRYADHRHHHQGRDGHPVGAEVKVKAGKPSSCTSPPTSTGEMHVHSSPEQEIEYTAGTTDEDPHAGPARASSTSRSTPWTSWSCSSRSAECPRSCPRLPRCALHGLGGAKDLPVPLALAVAAAVRALLVSFVVLALAWRTPRYEGVGPGRPAPAGLARVVDSAGFTAWTVRVLGLLFFGYLTWALSGRPRPGHQPGAGRLLRPGVGRPGAVVPAPRAAWCGPSARCARSTCCWRG